MSSSHFLRMGTLAGWGKLLAAARHNRRTLQRESGAAAHIDSARTSLNFTLHGEATPGAIRDKAQAMMRDAGIDKLRKNGVSAIEIIFSLPATTPIDHRAYFEACLAWAAREFTISNILSADVHLDEAAPHCHVLIFPLRDGRLKGSELMGDRKTMLDRQANFYETVSQGFGLSKPRQQRLAAEARQATSKAVLQALRAKADPCLKSSAWALIRDDIEREPVKWAECLGLDGERITKPIVKVKKPKTMTQIFTSPGKGPKREPEKPYRGLSHKNMNPYVSVGVCEAVL